MEAKVQLLQTDPMLPKLGLDTEESGDGMRLPNAWRVDGGLLEGGGG